MRTATLAARESTASAEGGDTESEPSNRRRADEKLRLPSHIQSWSGGTVSWRLSWFGVASFESGPGRAVGAEEKELEKGC